MTRTEAVERLRDRRDALHGMGATALYLFGSTRRDEATRSSDIDVFIDYDPQTRFNALHLMGIKLFLEAEMQNPIDITTRDGLHPLLKAEIERTAIRVF